MAENKRHTIKRQILEVSGIPADKARELQNRLRQIYHTRIVPLVDRYCTALSPNGQPVRIDRLELDLGNLNADRLEEEYVAAVDTQLKAYFQSLIRQQASEPMPEQGEKQASHHSDAESASKTLENEERTGAGKAKWSQLELLRYFIRYGSLPWWADTSRPNILTEALSDLIQHDRKSLIRWMSVWAREPDFLRRIVRQFRFPLWVDLAGLRWETSRPDFITQLSSLLALLRKIAPWQQMPTHRIEELFGIKSLSWIYGLPSPALEKWDSLAFWQGILVQLAAGQSVSYDRLLRALSRELESAEQSGERFSEYLHTRVGQLMREREVPPGGGVQKALFKRIRQLLKERYISVDVRARLKATGKQWSTQPPDRAELEAVRRWLDELEAGQTFRKVLAARIWKFLARESLPATIKDQLERDLKRLSAGTAEEGDITRMQALLAEEDEKPIPFSELHPWIQRLLKEGYISVDARARLEATVKQWSTQPPDRTELEAVRRWLDELEAGQAFRKALAARIRKFLTKESLPATTKDQLERDLKRLSAGTAEEEDITRMQALLAEGDEKPIPLSELPPRIQRLLKEGYISVDAQARLEATVKQWSTQPPDRTELEVVRRWLDELEAGQAFRKALAARIRKFLTKESLPATTKDQLERDLKRLSAGTAEEEDITRMQTFLREESAGFLQQVEPEQLDFRVEDPSSSPLDFSAGEELFLNNAGLVILWPFLRLFFEKLELLAEERFVDEAAAHRAVGLLQFLADGQPEPAEYLCGLNKILCGLDWDAVLDFGEPITEAEATECEQLLQAVIAHAPILGEMSVDGLRGSFLLRKGMLKSGPGVWQLHVEEETYDIVLEQFPWSWNMVKLPWMEWGMEVAWG